MKKSIKHSERVRHISGTLYDHFFLTMGNLFGFVTSQELVNSFIFSLLFYDNFSHDVTAWWQTPTFQNGTGWLNQRKWRACSPSWSTRCGTTSPSIRRPSASRNIWRWSWTGCRSWGRWACRPSSASSTWSWRAWCRPRPSSNGCLPRVFPSECDKLCVRGIFIGGLHLYNFFFVVS